MTGWISHATEGLIDPACVQDTFVEGIGAISKTPGGCVRFTLFQSRQSGNGVERLVVAHVVWPAEALAFAMQQCATFLRTGAFVTPALPSDVRSH